MINIVFMILIAIVSLLLFRELKARKRQKNLIKQETAALEKLKIDNLNPPNYGLFYYRNNFLSKPFSTECTGKSSSAA